MNKLLIARRRGYWSTSTSNQQFPLRVLLSPEAGLFEQLYAGIKSLLIVLVRRPEGIVFGTSTKIVSMYALLRRLGFFRKTFLVTDKQYLKEKDVESIDRIIVYSPNEIEQYPKHLQGKFTFLHYPSKVELVGGASLGVPNKDPYIFASGNNSRDYETFLEAIKGVDIRTVIVTDVLAGRQVPHFCEVYNFLPLSEYVSLMQGALFVVVPLQKSEKPHGHYVISSALSLGIPVITTLNAGVDKYVEDGKNGLLVKPGDVVSYRDAIKQLLDDKEKRNALRDYAQKNASDFSYGTFSRSLEKVCREASFV